MIPKVIHYCWFGRGQKNEMITTCIESWKRYLPDYTIKEWNEDNFDVNIIPYTAEAYRLKKYAFVSDYARFWILYNYGGIYFDTDVEVIKNMDSIIAAGDFMGCEYFPEHNYTEPLVASGLGIGAHAKNDIYKIILDRYNNMSYINMRGNTSDTVVRIVNGILKREMPNANFNEITKIKDTTIYPPEYFGPKNYYTGEIVLTENTYTIHHYAASWTTKKKKRTMLSKRAEQFCNIIKHICFIISYKFFKSKRK